MKILKTSLLLVVFSFCARSVNAQQCGSPSAQLATGSVDTKYACPASSTTSYLLEPITYKRIYNFTCTADNNVAPPPNPGTVYWSYNGSTESGFGQTYCNYSSPYSTYVCPPIMNMNVTRASSPTDYNRFYNQAYSYEASGGSCPQTTFEQDFQQCNGLACQATGPPCPQPTSNPPTCGESQSPSWDVYACSWSCVYSPPPSPILIDVSGHGFELTSAAGGVTYDISGNGSPIQMSWTAPGAQNAFLCLPDGNGGCNTGKQLFGNFTPQPQTSTPNGFAALAVYDTPANGGNGDGVIDAHDAIFSLLRLWIDSNHDGITQPNELFSLPQLGITFISLNYKWDQRTDQYGNVFRYRAQVGSTSGMGRMAYDVFFATQTNTNTAKGCPVPKALAKQGDK